MAEVVRAQSAKECIRHSETALPIREMFDLAQRNYGWESFKIQSPHSYIGAAVKIPKCQPKALKRGHYLNDLYLQTKHVPGVGRYNSDCFPAQQRGSHQPHPPHRKTYLDDIIDIENRQGTPGPGNYFRRERRSEEKREGKVRTAQRGTYLDEVEYLAAECPGIGEYNISTDLKRKGFNMKKQKQSGARHQLKKHGGKRQQVINPILEGTFDHIRADKRKHNKTWSKDSRFKLNTEQARVPSPQHYDLKRVWSASRTDHFTKQISRRQISIYH